MSMVDAHGEGESRPREALLVGLQVTDEAQYAEYRRRMQPVLHAHGGAFVVDLRVSEVLSAPGDVRFNRFFAIRFPSRRARERFFGDEAYLSIRVAYFETSVARTVILGPAVGTT